MGKRIIFLIINWLWGGGIGFSLLTESNETLMSAATQAGLSLLLLLPPWFAGRCQILMTASAIQAPEVLRDRKIQLNDWNKCVLRTQSEYTVCFLVISPRPSSVITECFIRKYRWPVPPMSPRIWISNSILRRHVTEYQYYWNGIQIMYLYISCLGSLQNSASLSAASHKKAKSKIR